ncbi:RHS repeat-associated core domain-containing protein [Pseudomonas sp. zfem004]|uniref:RHS repeat-associated core domain-containing protein n=1 Tax=Pseudomonas sp. zfem004 TaxID=3078199 RepID=UPI003977D94D
MNAGESKPRCWRAYGPYGYSGGLSDAAGLLGFNGVQADALTGNYALGNGHRIYNVGLMRFQCPDRLSPFGRGGLNAYAYCSGDPVNMTDPTGQFSFGVRRLIQGMKGWSKEITARKPLKNWETLKLDDEISYTTSKMESKSLEVRVVTDKTSLMTAINLSKTQKKWVLTDKGEVIVMAYLDPVLNRHKASLASMAAIAARDFQTSPSVVAAGWLKMEGNKVVIDNVTGHYRMRANRLWSAKMHFEKLAEGTKFVRDPHHF